MASEANSLSARKQWAEFVQLAEQRESELGHPVPNCPTAAQLRRYPEILSELQRGESLALAQLWAYMQELAKISDSWIDPESDPIGVHLHPTLEKSIEGLRELLNDYVPEAGGLSKTWAGSRALAQAAKRTVYREGLNPPPPLLRLWRNLKLFVTTTVAWGLFKLGKALGGEEW